MCFVGVLVCFFVVLLLLGGVFVFVFWGWLVCLFAGFFVCLVFGKRNPVSVMIPEEKPVTAGGFCAGLSKPAFAMSKRPRRSHLQGCYSCLGLVCCVYTVTNATGTGPCILVVVPEKTTAVKSQHASEKNTLKHSIVRADCLTSA